MQDFHLVVGAGPHSHRRQTLGAAMAELLLLLSVHTQNLETAAHLMTECTWSRQLQLAAGTFGIAGFDPEDWDASGSIADWFGGLLNKLVC